MDLKKQNAGNKKELEHPVRFAGWGRAFTMLDTHKFLRYFHQKVFLSLKQHGKWSFLKWRYRQIITFNRIVHFHYEPTILRIPSLRTLQIGEQCSKHGFPPLQLCPSTIAARTLLVSSVETNIFVRFHCTGMNQLLYHLSVQNPMIFHNTSIKKASQPHLGSKTPSG